jgi:hypothetical protein
MPRKLVQMPIITGHDESDRNNVSPSGATQPIAARGAIAGGVSRVGHPLALFSKPVTIGTLKPSRKPNANEDISIFLRNSRSNLGRNRRETKTFDT